MTKERKESIQVWSAIGMLAVGAVLVIAGFIVPPTGEVSDSVLWFFGECLIYAGGIFGVSIYFRTKLGSSITEIKDVIDRKFNEIRKEEKSNDKDIEEREQGQ